MAAAAEQITPKDLASEFVVGGVASFEPYVQRVDTRDRVELRLTRRAIDQLRLDPELESDISVLADTVFADGMEIIPALTDETDPEYQEASDIADFCQKATQTTRPLEMVLKEMFKAAFYNGVKIGEIVLRYQNDARIDGKLVLDRINPKPISATAFVTDKFYNVLGLVGARRAGQTVVSVGNLTLSKDEIIPREKFLVLAFELEDNDPRGLSQVRAAYEPYCDKQLTRGQWKEWRRTSAIPKKVGTTAPNAKPIALLDAEGKPIVENGVQKTMSAQKGLMNALEGFANNSAITAEDGTKVQQLEVSGKGEQFLNAIKFNNAEMRKVVLGDALVTGEADKDARAARESSKDVSDIRKQALRTVVAAAIETDILRLLTVVNFGEEKAHLAPKCFLGDTEANDWAGDLQAAAKAGYAFAPEHFAQLDTQFGLDPRENAPEPVTQPDPNAPPAQPETPQGETA
jgi:hypothetical protein